MTEHFDVVVIGGGIVGLATAHVLLERAPSLRLAVLEKEPVLASHQTGHNSGVVHSGIYYRPGSLKARLCREGRTALERFAAVHGIPYLRTGKLIVAVGPGERDRLADLRNRGVANGIQGIEEVGTEQIREIEPHVRGSFGLWVPETGVIDFRPVAMALADEIAAAGGQLLTGRHVVGLRRVRNGLGRAGHPARLRPRPVTADAAGAEPGAREPGALTTRGEDGAAGHAWLVSTTRDAYLAQGVIACAGLQSDRVAALTGHAGDERIVPFRGDYYHLRPSARHLIHGLVYPVPDPAFPFLGVHFTRRPDGAVWAGPNAVPAFAREGYRRTDCSPRDMAALLAWPGLWRLALPYLGTGLAEMWRDVSRAAFLEALQRYVPELRATDLAFGPSGVRAQSLRADGSLVDDFSLGEGEGIIHVRNAPSPAATASLAIGRMLASRAIERFELGARAHP
ncbi:MAG: FAD-dependent oxidoreductase [Candidatus Limnocylindrales bacterium]